MIRRLIRMEQVTVAILLDKFVNASLQVVNCYSLHSFVCALCKLLLNMHRPRSRSVLSAGRQRIATISSAAQWIHFLHDLLRYSVYFPSGQCVQAIRIIGQFTHFSTSFSVSETNIVQVSKHRSVVISIINI